MLKYRFMPKATPQTAPDSDNGSNSTRASSVYDRLQSDILTGKLKPGHKLRLKDLIELYDTGNSPLREALNRLSANGMVVREENRGFRVPPASTDELMEITRTRCWLEEIALRESIRNGDSDWEERIVLAFHWLARAARSTDEATRTTSPEWEEHHREFHLALTSARSVIAILPKSLNTATVTNSMSMKNCRRPCSIAMRIKPSNSSRSTTP
jgi:DNA-binding GntR family transcriptional regulator